jgi:quercetin dioxygenase-like cupin family protein
MELQVVEYNLAQDNSALLEAAPRIVYRIDEQEADYATGPLTLTGSAHVLAFELVAEASAEAMLSAPVSDPDPAHPRLIRLDTVSFPPGGVAYLHVHQGPGIRVLLEGEIRVDTDGQSHSYGPLEAWFESGPVPVFAAASESVPTAFVRCMVLPAELKGQRSLRYVRDEDADKPKLQEYRIFVDQPLSDAPVAT